MSRCHRWHGERPAMDVAGPGFGPENQVSPVMATTML
jgi:hypothetical protein